jgi:hypothetical protein
MYQQRLSQLALDLLPHLAHHSEPSSGTLLHGANVHQTLICSRYEKQRSIVAKSEQKFPGEWSREKKRQNIPVAHDRFFKVGAREDSVKKRIIFADTSCLAFCS